jgi:small-conductance mechanosensitive channel
MNSYGTGILGWVEIDLLAFATGFFICGWVPHLRSWRSLFWGACALAVITAVFPRRDNPLGQYLFVGSHGAPWIPLQLFGIAWWMLGAWLTKSLLALVLRRTIFPDDNEPHARRLFADLVSALIYVVAFVGIMDRVFKQPLSGVLATSGVLAIVLGLALQNTLADVFSGLAINIDRAFAAGDWVAVPDGIEGQIIEVNWRTTRIRTCTNAMIVIPNSVIAKAVVTNHSRLNAPYTCKLRIGVDHAIPPQRIIEALQRAASLTPGAASGAAPTAYACRFADTLIEYELSFACEAYPLVSITQSEVIQHIAEAFQHLGVRIGPQAVRIEISHDELAGAGPQAAAREMVGRTPAFTMRPPTDRSIQQGLLSQASRLP